MKIVFFGTPDYVLPILNSVHKRYATKRGESPFVALVTQSPKPVGRKQFVEYSAVDTWGHKHGIPVYYGSSQLLKEKIQADLGILESYGEILPPEVVNMFPHGILNAHPSLLPKWRGASPVQAAIVNGERETGVTIIKLDQKIDHGPILSQFKEEIFPEDTTDSLRRRLFERSADVFVELLEPYLAGKITLRPQDDSLATFTIRTRKEDGFIPPKSLEAVTFGKTSSAGWKIPFIKNYSLDTDLESADRFVRAMYPWPGAWTNVEIARKEKNEIKRLKILKCHKEELAGKKYLVLDEVQLEGKNPTSWKQFKEAYPKMKF